MLNLCPLVIRIFKTLTIAPEPIIPLGGGVLVTTRANFVASMKIRRTGQDWSDTENHHNLVQNTWVDLQLLREIVRNAVLTENDARICYFVSLSYEVTHLLGGCG